MLVTIAGAEDTYEDLFLPLHGRYQLVNLANAVAATEALLGRKLDEEVRDAVAIATVRGGWRCWALIPSSWSMEPTMRTASMPSPSLSTRNTRRPAGTWSGGDGDKNVEAMVESLEPLLAGIVATAPDSERAVPPAVLADRIRDLTDVAVLDADDTELAIDMARAEAGAEGAVLVAGSLYLVGKQGPCSSDRLAGARLAAAQSRYPPAQCQPSVHHGQARWRRSGFGG